MEQALVKLKAEALSTRQHLVCLEYQPSQQLNLIRLGTWS